MISVHARRHQSLPLWILVLQVEPVTSAAVWQAMSYSNIETAGLLLQLLMYFTALYYGLQWYIITL